MERQEETYGDKVAEQTALMQEALRRAARDSVLSWGAGTVHPGGRFDNAPFPTSVAAVSGEQRGQAQVSPQPSTSPVTSAPDCRGGCSGIEEILNHGRT